MKSMPTKKIKDLTGITCVIQIALELCTLESIDVIVLGGLSRKVYFYSYGYFASGVLENLRAEILFLGADAIHLPDRITNSTIDEIIVKPSRIKSSNQLILIADSTRDHLSAPCCVCAWEEVDWIITNDEADPCYLEFFQRQSFKVTLTSTKIC